MQEIKCPKCGEVFQVDESGYAAIVKQVRDREFQKELETRENRFEADKSNAVQLTKLEAEREHARILSEKDREIAELKNKLATSDTNRELELTKLKNKMGEELAEKNNKIERLNNEKELADRENRLKEQTLKEQYEITLKLKDEEIAHYKDFKAKQSTKMVGESLEQHCQIEFNRLRATGFQKAFFEKDNDIKTGSKGDFIYRDYTDDGEFISIMFEMKNETDSTATKKKNEDFLKELDKDRREKGCEYAVLVSLLEPENELYNTGIVDVSYKYPKMYVIRPQFFIPIITILRNAALNSIEYKKELAIVKSQNIDVANFEAGVAEIKDKFLRNYELSHKQFLKAVDEIDKSIDHLQKIKEALLSSTNNYRLAVDKLEGLNIKKLTKNNPTMEAKFAALKANADE